MLPSSLGTYSCISFMTVIYLTSTRSAFSLCNYIYSIQKRRNAAREDVPENVYVEGGAIGTHDDVDHGDGNYNGGGRSKQGMSHVGSMKSSLSRGMGSIKSKFSRKKEADDDDYEAHFDNDEYGGQSAYM